MNYKLDNRNQINKILIKAFGLAAYGVSNMLTTRGSIPIHQFLLALPLSIFVGIS